MVSSGPLLNEAVTVVLRLPFQTLTLKIDSDFSLSTTILVSGKSLIFTGGISFEPGLVLVQLARISYLLVRIIQQRNGQQQNKRSRVRVSISETSENLN